MDMNTKAWLMAVIIFVLLIAGCSKNAEMQGSGEESLQKAVQVGDSLAQVEKALGEPSIEFPDGNRMIHWFSEYEVVTSNNVVIAVKSTSDEA